MHNTVQVSKAFTIQSAHFDEFYQSNPMVEYMRKRVYSHVLKYHKPGKMLELNSGTGTDALFFHNKGFEVYATDNAVGMIEAIKNKILPNNKIYPFLCNFENIEIMQKYAPFDSIYSNFGGLNCTSNLFSVLEKCIDLLRPQGRMTLVIMPKNCPWEWLEIFTLKPKIAFRRYKKQNNTHLESVFFTTYYYNPKTIIHRLSKKTTLTSWEGLCSICPPSYKTKLIKYFPFFWKSLAYTESKISTWRGFRSYADYVILTFQKNSNRE
jgi:ubiquinone/menaquinone biosynthesis C-methylase UbiE